MLIGLNGQIGAGKDAVYERALVLSDKIPGVPLPERVAFADKLKLAAARSLGVDVTVLEGLKRNNSARVELSTLVTVPSDEPSEGEQPNGSIWDGEVWEQRRVRKSITVREYLQRFGTEVGRDTFGDMFWVDQALPPDLDHTGRLIFVTDTRFENEADQVHRLGGIVVRVLNGPLLTPEHASEKVLDSRYIDFEIDNSVRDDNFQNLDNQIKDVLELLQNAERNGSHEELSVVWRG